MTDVIATAMRNSKEVHYSVELALPGFSRYYSDQTMSIPSTSGDDKLHDGLLLDFPEIGAAFDFSGPKYQGQDVQIRLANKGRLQDLESTIRVDGSVGTIRVWSPGLTWEQIETNGVIYRGTIKKRYHTRSEYVLDLINLADTKLKLLTGYYFDTDIFPSLRMNRTSGGGTSPSGQVIPFVFGNWSRGVPLYCTVPWTGSAANYVIGLYSAKSTDADYTAGTKVVYNYVDTAHAVGNYTFYPSVLTPAGVSVIYVQFSADPTSSEPNHCGVEGIYDALGLYTTAGELIEHPADIMRFLIDNHSNIDAAHVDLASFGTFKALADKIRYCTLINQAIEGRAMLDRLASQCWAAIMPGGLGIGIVAFDTRRPTVGRISELEDGAADVRISATDSELIANKITCEYSWNGNTSAYEGVLTKDKTNSQPCHDSYYQYGEQPEVELLFPDVGDENVAIALADKFIDFRAMRHDMVEWIVPWHVGWPIKEGDICELTVQNGPSADGAGWVDEKAILLERHFTGDGIRQKWWRINT